MKHKEGFTLIELLVVIAIIAILASILFPVFARARAKAQQTTCLSTMKQLMLAFNMYWSDYDQMLPQAKGTDLETNYWHDAIYPYIRERFLFRCPSNPYQYWPHYSHYGMNMHISWRNTDWADNVCHLILLTDSLAPFVTWMRDWNPYSSFFPNLASPHIPLGIHFGAAANNWLDGMVTCGFVDGHAQVYDADVLSAPGAGTDACPNIEMWYMLNEWDW